MSLNTGYSIVLVAAGRSERFGGKPKLLLNVGNYPVIFYILSTIFTLPDLERVVIVASQPVIRWLEANISQAPVEVKVISGGYTRSLSVWLGLQQVDTEVVLIHDAARCNTPPFLFNNVVNNVGLNTGCVPVMDLTDTIVLVDEKHTISGLTDRANFKLVQTPQGFRTAQLKEAFLKTGIDKEFTDEGTRFHSAGFKVVTIPGDKNNVKLTWPADIFMVTELLKQTHPLLFADVV